MVPYYPGILIVRQNNSFVSAILEGNVYKKKYISWSQISHVTVDETVNSNLELK